eukprot:3396215-Pleurochrysis_carterae.AAC.1
MYTCRYRGSACRASAGSSPRLCSSLRRAAQRCTAGGGGRLHSVEVGVLAPHPRGHERRDALEPVRCEGAAEAHALVYDDPCPPP